MTPDQLNSKRRRVEMRNAFEAVQNPLDWRDRIDAIIPRDLYDITRQAVAFYTATELVEAPPLGAIDPDHMRVVADGYRMGPAGP